MDRSKTTSLYFRLERARWLVVYRERELVLTDAKAQSFVYEHRMLQGLSLEERPAEYNDVLLYVERQIIYFRDRRELTRERYVMSRSLLHEVLIDAAGYFSEDDEMLGCYRAILHEKLPLPCLPPENLDSQELAAWLDQLETKESVSTLEARIEILTGKLS